MPRTTKPAPATRIDWSTLDVSKGDLDIIRKIVKRAAADDLIQAPLKPMDLLMDLEATHANGNPLRLQALLNADAFNFAHDILGIQNTMDRTTGQLQNCFQPRYTDYEKLRELRHDPDVVENHCEFCGEFESECTCDDEDES